MDKSWLKTLGAFEMILASVLCLLSIWVFWGTKNLSNDPSHSEMKADTYLGLLLISPIILCLLIMGITAYRAYKTARLIQIMGWLLIGVVIPMLIFF